MPELCCFNIGWYSSFYDRSQLRLTVGFATLFFAIFAVAPLLAAKLRTKRGCLNRPALLVLVNAAGYFLQIYIMYEETTAKTPPGSPCSGRGVHLSQSANPGQSGKPGGGADVDLLHLALAIGFIHGCDSHTTRRPLGHYGLVCRSGRALMGGRPGSF